MEALEVAASKVRRKLGIDSGHLVEISKALVASLNPGSYADDVRWQKVPGVATVLEPENRLSI